MSQSRAGIYGRCPHCRLNNNLCLCAWIKSIKCESNISLVVHVRELTLTSNTAQFVEKLLPDQSQIFIRGKQFENFDAAPIVERSGTPLFLYPHEDAQILNEEFKSKHPGPYHIIVPDGNWHQARRVRKREELFKSIPAITLPSGIETVYKLRKAPCPEWLSTFEAVAYALGILESPEIKDHMMKFFKLWVQQTIFNRTKDKNANPFLQSLDSPVDQEQ